MATDTYPVNPLYCGNYPERDHTDCPSSVECATATVADLPPSEPEITTSAIREVLAPHFDYIRVQWVSDSRHDHIQSFTVGPGNADRAAQILAEAGYFVHYASNYVVHVIR